VRCPKVVRRVTLRAALELVKSRLRVLWDEQSPGLAPAQRFGDTRLYPSKDPPTEERSFHRATEL